MTGCIYAFKNKINGKYYIGQTTNIRVRYNRHMKGMSSCIVFNKAMRKYGKDAFEFSILVDGINSKELLNELEIKLIAEYKAYQKGYNLTPGGNARSEEQNKRCAESARLHHKKMTDEQRKAKSEKCRLRALEQWSDPKNKETMKIASLNKKPRIKRMTNTKADKIFKSINSKIRIAHNKAALMAEMERKKTDPISIEMAKRNAGRKIYCKELGITFGSAYKAAQSTGCKREYISHMCLGTKYYNLPYTFEYVS